MNIFDIQGTSLLGERFDFFSPATDIKPAASAASPKRPHLSVVSLLKNRVPPLATTAVTSLCLQQRNEIMKPFFGAVKSGSFLIFGLAAPAKTAARTAKERDYTRNSGLVRSPTSLGSRKSHAGQPANACRFSVTVYYAN
ncbi:hypothetical protein [Bordetella petrii]|uniref:hypothetical protein n=1 Tax=Bordetella petrii TaxID=94624 RepID=UPI001E412B75|nr:hypothetical protein [Bordetella petrii]MCD0502055.1 hypothetical protein [Bordetella petrii]